MPSSYNAEGITVSYRQRPLLVWKRQFIVVQTFLSLIVRLGWDKLTSRIVQNQLLRASQLREKLTKLGPTFIKLGQILSCRPDLVPPVYIEELANLQDQLPPFANELAYQILEDEFGCSYDQIYAELSPHPVAAASLGQVYRGKLKTGELVAVKVQRPNLIPCVALDIYILRHLAAWVQKTFKVIHSDLVALIDELASRLFEEIDYCQEAANAERFAQLYSHIKTIYVPRIYWQYTSHRVLTMEWISGIKLTQIEALRDRGLNPSYLIEVGFECSLRQLLEAGFFHADPHPGNLLVTPDGKLAYLDFGMMSFVEPFYRDRLLESILHILTGDFEALAQDYVKLGFLPAETNLKLLVPELADVFGKVLGASVAEFGFKSIIQKLSPLIYKYPFQLPTYYLLILRCFATLEGLALNLDPNFQPFTQGYSYLAQRLLTDSSLQLRTLLQEVLFQNGQIQWHILEDLLKNTYNNKEVNINLIFHQSLEFLYSQQGGDLRDTLVDEIVTSLEAISKSFVKTAAEWIAKPINTLPTVTIESKSLGNLQRVVSIIQQSPSFERISVSEILGLLLKPETQSLGQEIATEWARRMYHLIGN